MTSSSLPRSGPSQTEFIAIVAMLFATIALSIDAMLPALPQIAAELTPENINRAQFVVGGFFLGMGIGTLVAGPLSDAFGRKPVILGGAAVYILGAVACYFAQSFEVLIAARIFQGIGASGPRTVSMALVRDLYKGREMARIMSFAMMIFMVVPAVAPLLGTTVMLFASWRAIFLVLMVFSFASMIWIMSRQPETLPPEKRIPVSLSGMVVAGKDLFSRLPINISILIQSLTMAMLVASISSIHSVFERHFDRAESFPYWFALIAGLSGFASFLNSRLVVRLGMRRVATLAYCAALAITLVHLGLRYFIELPPMADFVIFLIWMTTMFGTMSLTMGNLNALAMEPVGHIAGFAASMIGAVSTVLSVILAAPIGQAFDGTPMPLVVGAAILMALSLFLMRYLGPSTHGK